MKRIDAPHGNVSSSSKKKFEHSRRTAALATLIEEVYEIIDIFAHGRFHIYYLETEGIGWARRMSLWKGSVAARWGEGGQDARGPVRSVPGIGPLAL
jgi:hypothetical protein